MHQAKLTTAKTLIKLCSVVQNMTERSLESKIKIFGIYERSPSALGTWMAAAAFFVFIGKKSGYSSES